MACPVQSVIGMYGYEYKVMVPVELNHLMEEQANK